MRLFLIALGGLLLPSLAALAAGPLAPCEGGLPAPAYGAIDGAPVAASWSSRELRRERWQPPSCLGWQGDSRLVAALAARFRSPLSLDQLAERLTAVSRHRSISFWAVTMQEWRPLVADAWALDGAHDTARRPDPLAAALVPGRDLYYAEESALAGRAVYRLHVVQHTADRLVLASENVTPIHAMVTLFEPGGLQIASFLTRAGADTWDLYEISRAGAQSNSLVSGSAGAYLNRLEAMRRHLAGIPTDREPPLAPW